MKKEFHGFSFTTNAELENLIRAYALDKGMVIVDVLRSMAIRYLEQEGFISNEKAKDLWLTRKGERV